MHLSCHANYLTLQCDKKEKKTRNGTLEAKYEYKVLFQKKTEAEQNLEEPKVTMQMTSYL